MCLIRYLRLNEKQIGRIIFKTYIVNFSARAYIRGEVIWKMTIDPTPWPSPVEQQEGLSTSMYNSCIRACSGPKKIRKIQWQIVKNKMLFGNKNK